jgi:hypothetical protein
VLRRSILEVPGWIFAVDGAATACGSGGGSSAAAAAAAGAGGGALYFAQAPPQHVERYCAVLTSRPPGPVREGAAVVVMPRASPPTFVVGLYKLSPVDP